MSHPNVLVFYPDAFVMTYAAIKSVYPDITKSICFIIRLYYNNKYIVILNAEL